MEGKSLKIGWGVFVWIHALAGKASGHSPGGGLFFPRRPPQKDPEKRVCGWAGKFTFSNFPNPPRRKK